MGYRQPHITELSQVEAERVARAADLRDAMEIRPASREQAVAWNHIDRDWQAEDAR